MDDTTIELCETFVAECLDYIDELEPQFIALAQAIEADEINESQQLMNHIFRLIHTIKGSAGSLGFRFIASLAHKAENLLDSVRNKRIPLTPDRLDLLTQSLDVFKLQLRMLQTERTDEGTEHLIVDLVLCLDRSNQAQAGPCAAIPASTQLSPGLYVFDDEPEAPLTIKITDQMRRTFVQEAEESIGKVELSLLSAQDLAGDQRQKQWAEALRVLHSFKGNCGFMQLTGMEALLHGMESLLLEIEKGEVPEDKVEDLLRGLDLLKLGVSQVSRAEAPELPSLSKLLQQLDPAAKAAALPKNDTAARAPSSKAEARTKADNVGGSAQITRSDVRVDLKKLDTLINLVGELVVAEAMVSGWVSRKGIEDEGLDRAVHHLRRTALSLQDVAMSVRMVPLGNAFNRFTRVIRDLSRSLNKKIDLVITGEAAELDKTLVEQIGDPLIHLIRNSCDHGIELPDVRKAAGKNPTGKIFLSAHQEGNQIVIKIEDDGKGMDPAVIRRKAIEKGIIAEEAQLSPKDCLNLIFEAGFSTAEQVTNISGRGVGMDVVKKQIMKLKGMLELDSVAGRGTTITIRLPLTLAIVQSLLVRSRGETFAIPLNSVIESIRISPKEIQKVGDVEVYKLRETVLPLIHLDDAMTLATKEGSISDLIKRKASHHRRRVKQDRLFIVVVGQPDRPTGIIVDQLLNQQEMVIKSMGPLMRNIPCVAGGAVLGHGEVVLVLDIPELEAASRGRGRMQAA